MTQQRSHFRVHFEWAGLQCWMTMRLLTGCLVLAVSGFASAQDLSKSIQYTTVAEPLHKALDDISKQAGVKLYASQELEDEPIILRLNGVTAKDFMDRLEQIVGAKFQARGQNEFMLSRTDEMREKLRSEALDKRAALLADAIHRAVDTLNAQPYDDQHVATLASSYASMVKMQKNGQETFGAWRKAADGYPDARAVIRVLSHIDPKRLAAIPTSTTQVFSNDPTHIQERAEFDAGGIGDQFAQEQNSLAQAMQKAIKTEDYEPLHVMATDPERHIVWPPTRFVLRVSAPVYLAGGLLASVIGFDKQNKPVMYGSSTLPLVAGGFDAQMADHTRAENGAKNEAALALSDASQVMMQHLKSVMQNRGGDAKPIPTPILDKALHPEDFDPLAFIVSDALLGDASANNANAIIYPDDMMLGLLFFAGQDGSLKASLLPDEIKTMGGGDLLLADGWLTYHPKDIIGAWNDRTNREVLGECLRDANEHGFVSIDLAGKLAESERSPGDRSLLAFLEMLYGRYYSPYYERDKNTLLFYTSLDDAQKALLKDGLSASDLNKEQFGKLQDIAFDDKGDWFISYDPGTQPTSDNVYSDFAVNEASREPTERFAEGIPSSARVKLEVVDSPTYFAGFKTGGGLSFSQNTPLEGLAYNIAEHELYKGDPNNWEGQLEVDWIAPGHSHKMNFNFQFDKHMGKNRSLEQASRDGTTQWTLDTLPDDIKKQLKDLVGQRKTEIQSWHHEAPPTAAPPSNRL